MELKDTVETEDKLLENEDNVRNCGQILEQDSELEETREKIHPFIDVEDKIEIKEEPLDFVEEYSENGQLIVLMKEEVCPNLDLRKEIEMKCEPSNINEEYTENNQHIEQFSGLDKNQIHVGDVEHRNNDDRLKVKSPLRNEPQSSRRKYQKIKNKDVESHEKDELELQKSHKESLPQAKLMRQTYSLRPRNIDTKTSTMYSGPASALLDTNVKNDNNKDCKNLFVEEITVIGTKKCNNTDETFTCSYCGQKFVSRWGLNCHIQNYTCEKTFKCSHCNRSFDCRNILEIHIRTHFKCSYCEKGFDRKSYLEKHIRIHTGEKPFKCSYCDKSFKHKHRLETHIRIHTGEKPFKCSYCDQSFNRKDNLDTHIRTHTGEKPYECFYCDKSFNHKNSLESHIATHTGEEAV